MATQIQHHHIDCDAGAGGAATGSSSGGDDGVGEALDLFLDVDGEQLIFADDTFPSLPDFHSTLPMSPPPVSPPPIHPCLSSSSSTSSSASSTWIGNGAGCGGDMQLSLSTETHPMSGDQDVLDILDEIDVIDHNLLFVDDNMLVDPAGESQTPERDINVNQLGRSGSENFNMGNLFGELTAEGPSTELAEFFLEWLKNNKDCISAEDLRNIKLSTATVEAATRRLGGGKQGRAKLVKLILTWVQNHHLQKKRRGEQQHTNAALQTALSYNSQTPEYPAVPVTIATTTNPTADPNLEYNFEADQTTQAATIPQCSSWISYPDQSIMFSYGSAAMVPYQFPGNIVNCQQGWGARPHFQVAAPAPYSPVVPPPGYAPFTLTTTPQPLQVQVQPPTQFAAGFPAGQQQMYNQPQFAAPSPTAAPAPAPTPTSATKEARQKRMARKRVATSYHSHHHCQQQHHQQQLQQLQQQHKISRVSSTPLNSKPSSSKQPMLRPKPAAVALPAPPPAAPPPPITATPMLQQKQLSIQPGGRRQVG